MTRSIALVVLSLSGLWGVRLGFAQETVPSKKPPTVIVDTGQTACYDEAKIIPDPKSGQKFFGQDAQYIGLSPSYRDNGDGTIEDLNTGLVWSKAVSPDKVNLEEAEAIAAKMDLGGQHDWRVPTIKELYSLIDFRGFTGFSAAGFSGPAPANAIPFLNTDYFDFLYGASNERFIDAQWLSRTVYVSTTMKGNKTVFGVNFADGRIKGYGTKGPDGKEKKFYARYVRGAAYGENDLVDNGDGTITDRATGLMWTKKDSGKGMTWEQALAWAEELTLAGHEDWRLPNAKELQQLVDYTRSPDTTDSPAISALFETTSITNEGGQKDFPFFWTSTTHLDGPVPASGAAYLAFGRAIGQMHNEVMDVHGAGAQRSDPKVGTARIGHGPQGDAQRIQNFVRCVRGGMAILRPEAPKLKADSSKYPQTIRVGTKSYQPEAIDFSAKPMGPPPDEQSPSGSEQKSGGDGGKAFLRHLDKDGDGKVSRSEFDGPPDRFDFHDANKDGFITAEEAPTGPPPGGGGSPPRKK
jgi:hypothetical protein